MITLDFSDYGKTEVLVTNFFYSHEILTIKNKNKIYFYATKPHR